MAEKNKDGWKKTKMAGAKQRWLERDTAGLHGHRTAMVNNHETKFEIKLISYKIQYKIFLQFVITMRC